MVARLHLERLAAHGQAHDLVAQADAEHRQVVVGGLAQPRRAALAPLGVVGDEGGRAGHQHAGEAVRIGQGATVFDIDHHCLVFFQPGGNTDPVREAPVAAQRRHRAAGFKDQERSWVHPGAAALTGLPRL
ncbi:hypothetical protein G6F57_013338 [Rhizopus arrhizus]|nr:hypothetical protein G6F57_013338 [Rhizopus arrhizus]